MAGPCLSVLVAKHDSDNVQRIHESAIDLVSSSREGDNFWVTDTSPINGKCRAGGQPYFSNVLTVNVDDELSDFNKSEVDQIATIMGRNLNSKYQCVQCVIVTLITVF